MRSYLLASPPKDGAAKQGDESASAARWCWAAWSPLVILARAFPSGVGNVAKVRTGGAETDIGAFNEGDGQVTAVGDDLKDGKRFGAAVPAPADLSECSFRRSTELVCNSQTHAHGGAAMPMLFASAIVLLLGLLSACTKAIGAASQAARKATAPGLAHASWCLIASVMVVGNVAMLVSSALPSYAAVPLVSFTDGDFDPAIWSSEIAFVRGTASITADTVTLDPATGTMGNPGAFRRFSHTYNQDVRVAHWPAGLIVNPSDHPVVTTVEFSIDAVLLEAIREGARICFGAIAKQDGKFFSRGAVDENGNCVSSMDFESRSFTKDMKLRFRFVPEVFDAAPPGTMLDLSGAGGPIRLGVFTSNSGANQERTTRGGFDNVSIVVNASMCGDGLLEGQEECDDANATDGDGCSAACRIEGFCEDSLTCNAPCDEDADCAPSCGLCIRCGDGRVDTGETCDDGNDVCGDGCDPNCAVSGCGNGYICAASGEDCDNGNTTPGDGCSATCACEGACGDGVPNLVEGCEECDADGANCPLGTCCESGCSADCTQVSRCTGTFDCCVDVNDCPAGEGCCGDGVASLGEECDDGNAVRGDGCNELCQRECAQPLPRATPSPLSSDELKCQRTINKEMSKFTKAKAKALQKCAEAIIKDKTTSDPGPGARVNFCLTNQGDAVALKAQFKIDRAMSKIQAKIAKVCGGDDRECGTFDRDEATPDAIGFHATCPGFEGRGSCTGGTNDRAICTADSDCTGGGTCATCDGPIDNCDDLASCVACIGETALDQAIALYYDSLVDVPAGDLQKCQTTIGKEAAKFIQQKEKNLQKCWDKALKSQHADRCPDGAAPEGTATRKAAEKIARAESKMVSKICRKCGGGDGQCDDAVRVVGPITPPFPGSGGTDDAAPSGIGFPTTCDAVTVPGGPACGFGVNTLADLVSCVACVGEFKVDCIDAARMPELQGRVYPCECSQP